jgi:uncharacterized protein (TIGR02300 family)
MTTAAAAVTKRGIKRLCQSEPCGLPFYDLNKSPIECPNCGEGFTPVAAVVYKGKDYGKRPQYKLFKPVDPIEAEEKLEAAGDDALENTVEDADDAEDTGKIETLLEIDEDDGDDAIDTGVKKGEVE